MILQHQQEVICIGLSNIDRNLGVAIVKETICGVGGVSVGYRSQNSQTDVIHIGRDNFSNAISADIFGVNRTNSTANSLLLGNGSYTNIRANSTCDLGTSAIPFQTLFSNTSIAGTTNSRLTNDIVSNTSTGVTGNLPSFVSAKVIGDSGIVASTLTGGPFLKLDGTSSMFGLPSEEGEVNSIDIYCSYMCISMRMSDFDTDVGMFGEEDRDEMARAERTVLAFFFCFVESFF